MIEGQEGVGWEQWLALAEAAERAGLESLFRSDHYRSIALGEPAGALDAWATLAALAARTDRIRLGTLVSPVTFRAAGVLAKNVVTVTTFRAAGSSSASAGWYEAEHVTYGFPFGPSIAARRARPPPRRSFGSGRSPRRAPKPLQRPHPPIIVGGRGKPRTVAAAVGSPASTT
jgi:alkanesulfonate monooxygenase SsuD/methylene tetrahydromethanopterin reductase-like flavin-dependent oxidoreductase (luciferase family)